MGFETFQAKEKMKNKTPADRVNIFLICSYAKVTRL